MNEMNNYKESCVSNHCKECGVPLDSEDEYDPDKKGQYCQEHKIESTEEEPKELNFED